MTIELYFSNQLDRLADRFCGIVMEEVRNSDDIFAAPNVIVPNANLAKWLKLFMVEKNAIFMHMAFQYLEAGLWSMLTSLDPVGAIPEMLDDDRLRIMLLYALHNLDSDDPDLAPLSQYLRGEDGKRGMDYPPRLWQLAEKLAYLFREYEFHRMGMLREWSEGSTRWEGMALCQQRLYTRLKALRVGLEERTGTPLLSVMEYADRALSESRLEAGAEADRKPVHFFGLSQISSSHLTLIGRLQNHYRIHIYALNPSREFWEDVRTPGEKRWIQRRNVKRLALQAKEREQGELLDQDDNPLLAAWGKPGRESVRLLCELTGYDFSTCFADPAPGSGMLQLIQNDILTLAPAEHRSGRAEQDRSLQVVACPSVPREVETVFNSILYNLEQDDSLQLTDFAVLVPDISTYKPVFDSVFHRSPQRLAYNLVDSRAEIESIYGKAVLGLMALATGRFSRSEVFDLLLNPCFMSRGKIDLDDVNVWANWTDKLNIFHTYDRDEKAAKGYPPTDAYTWKQGLQRLRMSRILAGPNETNAAGFEHFEDVVPYGDLHTGDAALLEKFCVTVETLHHAATALGAKHATAEAWKQTLFGICDQLLEIPQDLRGESAVQQALIRAFDNLRLYDRLQEDAQSAALDADMIQEFVRANLGSIPGGQGDYLTGGVTISALQPMRPIPFRMVYVLGMEEGNFPGRSEQSSLDLRLSKRQIGDISLPERNRYLFLEVLLSVKEKLYISYVSRDLQKDRDQQACSVVSQLIRYVDQEILPEDQHFRVCEAPLAGSSDRFVRPGEVNDWSDVMVNYDLADRVACYRAGGLWEKPGQSASAEDVARVARLNPDLSTHGPEYEGGERQVERVTAKELKRFLENPVRQKIQRHLGLYDEEDTLEDLVSREEEPFFSEFPLDYHLRMEPVRRWLDARLFPSRHGPAVPDPEGLFALVYEHHRRMNQTPEGAFARIDRKELRGHVYQIMETLTPVLDSMASAQTLLRAVCIGDQTDPYGPAYDQSAVKRLPPLSLTVQATDHRSESVSCDAELHGQLPWMWHDPAGRWHTLVVTGSRTKPREPDRYVLEPVIFYLLCLCGEDSGRWIGDSAITVHAAYREHLQEWTYRFDQKTAMAYLARVVADLLDQSKSEWLPFEKVTKLSIRPHTMADDEIDDFARRLFAAELEEAYAEQEDRLVHIAMPTVPHDAFDQVRERFKIFFDLQKA